MPRPVHGLLSATMVAMRPAVGHASTKLVVLRGNSGSGKSTIARQLRSAYGRGCALVEQDYFRRIVLRERSEPGDLTPLLLDQTIRLALDHGYHVILEGILKRFMYGEIILSLLAAHRGRSSCYYLDVTWEETLRRHAGRSLATAFGAEEMRSWWAPGDTLGVPGEHLIPEAFTLERSVAYVGATSGLVPSP